MTSAAPLTPRECNLQDFPFMPLEVKRLLNSETWVLGSGDERAAAMTLWLQSWHQVPAGSLPAKDEMLAHLAATPTKWKKVKAHALRGWVLCSDGRLYHPIVCEKVLEAWIEKLLNSLSGTSGNAKRWGVEIDITSIRQQLLRAIGMLKVLAPQSKTLKKKAVVSIAAGSPPDSPPDTDQSSPPDSSGDRKRQGQRQRQGLSNTETVRTSTVLGAEDDPFAHTPAGDVGRALMRAGVSPDTINLADVRLAVLLTQGYTPEEFEGLAKEAVGKGIEHVFGWVLKVLPERRAEAAGIKAAPPAPEVPWFDTAKGVRDTGLRLGCGDWSDEIYAATGEQYPTYKRRVLAAARRAGMPMPEDITA